MSLKTKVVKKVVRYAFKTKRGKKLLSEAQKLINFKKSKLRVQESLKKTGPRIQAKTDIRYKFKQKPKTGGGAETHPQQLSYGVGAKEHKINQKLASIAARRPAYKGAHHLDESWRSEMTRLFGGVHMAQDPKLIKKSIKLLVKKLKKKKIKKATEGGEVVVHANVDRSLL